MSKIGVVAIGRNEGERLRRCLDALVKLGTAIVYVDSGSTDDSNATARARGASVVELDLSTPFTAARARNAGFERLLEVDPGVRFVQFLDGDCEIADGWLDRGRRALEERPRAAVAFGRRNERHPERSIYNRLADFEWNYESVPDPDGSGAFEVPSCGGDALMRVEAFGAVGGYDPTVPAGEEPELCQRLGEAGWSVVRLDADMTWHDSAMLRFGQWAKRQFRSGYGCLDYSTRFGRPRGADLFRRQNRSVRVWALGWPTALVASGALAGWLGGPAVAGAAVGLLAMAPIAQALRIASRNRGRAGDRRGALAYGALTMVGKFYQMAGQLLYLRDRLAGRHARLIEYKLAGSRSPSRPKQPAPSS